MIGGAGFPRAATLYKWKDPIRSKGKEVVGQVLVHGFVTDSEDWGEGGAAHYAAAIIEFPDGSLDSRPVQLVKLDKETGPFTAHPSHPSEAGPA